VGNVLKTNNNFMVLDHKLVIIIAFRRELGADC
jgi:hypothetical protein